MGQFRAARWQFRAAFLVAFQAHVPAFQTHTAPEHLDDLRSFANADVHQAHGRHAPRVPAGNEAPRADDDVHRRITSIHVGKEPLGKTGFTGNRDVRVGLLRQQFVQGRGITDINHAKGRPITGVQVQFTLACGQVNDVQFSQSVKQGGAQVRIEIVGFVCRHVLGKIREPVPEIIPSAFVGQAGLPAQQLSDHGARRVAVGQHPGQKIQYAYDV